jgi:hypothetical protein
MAANFMPLPPLSASLQNVRAEYRLLRLTGNQPTLEVDVEDYFCSAPAEKRISTSTIEKGHGRNRDANMASSGWIGLSLRGTVQASRASPT